MAQASANMESSRVGGCCSSSSCSSSSASLCARDIVEVWLPILHRLVKEERSTLQQVHYILDAYHTPLLEHKELKKIITFMQHWTLFSNIKTLYNSQEVLVDSLAAIVNEAEKLISTTDADASATAPANGDGSRDVSGAAPVAAMTRERFGGGPPPLQTASMQLPNSNKNNNNNTPRSVSDSTGAAATASPPKSFQDTLEAVLSLFCGPSMRHFIAEHMMFSLNYSRTIAPELLKISRVLSIHQARRRSSAMSVEGMCEFITLGDASQKLLAIGALSESGVPQLSTEDKDVLNRYQAFLQYVFFRLSRDSDATSEAAASTTVEESGGNRRRTTWSPSKGSGNTNSVTPLVSVEDHSQAPTSHSPSKKGAATAKAPLGTPSIPGLVQAFANIFPGNQHLSSSSFHGALQGPRSGAHKDGAKTGKDAHASQGFAATEIVLPTLDDIPHTWNGLHKLLGMLSVPLPSLRRYLHVARCLIEAQSPLSFGLRHRFQTDFIDVAALRIAEESSLVLDQILQQDVSRILALMEESGAGDRRITVRPCTDGSRVLVHYGRVVKRFRRGRHERLMFLFSDWLCYVEELSNGRLRLRGSIPLQNVVVNDVESSLSLDIAHCFEVVSNDTCLVLFAQSHTEKCVWMDAIRAAVSRDNAARKCKAGEHGHQSGDVEKMVRSTAPPVPTRSRLHRQRAYDARVQQSMEELTSRPPLQELKRLVARQNTAIAAELRTEDDQQPSSRIGHSDDDVNDHDGEANSSCRASEYDELTDDAKCQHAREMSSTTRSDGAGASFSSGLSAPHTALATRRASRTSAYRTGTPRTHSSDPNSSPPVAPSLRRTLSRSQFQSFDVSHWAQPSNGSAHRRMRSTEVLQQFTRTFRSDSMQLDDDEDEERRKAQQGGSSTSPKGSPETSTQLPKETASEAPGSGNLTPLSRPMPSMLKTPTRPPQPTASGFSASTPMRSAELSGRPPIHPPLPSGTGSPIAKEGEPSANDPVPVRLEANVCSDDARSNGACPVRALQLSGGEDAESSLQKDDAPETLHDSGSSVASSSQASTSRTPPTDPSDQKTDNAEPPEGAAAAISATKNDSALQPALEPAEDPSPGIDPANETVSPAADASLQLPHPSTGTSAAPHKEREEDEEEDEGDTEDESEAQPAAQSKHVDPTTL